MLRRTLPLWKWKETVAEVIDYCKKYDIDEVIWMIDVEDFNHGLTPVEIIREYIPVLEKVKDMLICEGIRFSINPWSTLGHGDRGRDMRIVHCDMQFMVDWTGIETKATGCPLSSAWRKWLCEAYRLYAGLGPHVLWVEDDIRTFNHSPASQGCFCELHLNRFSKLVGKQVKREELIKNILSEGDPHPWREKWLEMSGEIMVEVVSELEDAVHSVNPEVNLGLMCSMPEEHAMEGRKWKELITSLSGTRQPVARPCMVAYRETLPKDFIWVMDITRSTIACLPENTKICPELENFNYTTFSKSVNATRMQLGICALLGVNNITLNLYDAVGTPMKVEEGYLKMLKKTKPVLEGILSGLAGQGTSKEIGVGIEHLNEGPKYTHLIKGSKYNDLNPDCMGWSVPLQSCGIPVTYGDSDVKAVTGQYFRQKNKDEIIKILSRGILMDSSAVMVLQEMGYGEYTGVNVKRLISKDDRPIVAEEYMDEEFGGSESMYITLTFATISELFADMDIHNETRVISYIVDEDRKRIFPALTAYQNSLGGKVAVYSGDLSKKIHTGFLNWERVRQLGEVIGWLSGEQSMYQVISGAYQYTLCREYEDFVFIGITNLSSDDMENIKICFRRQDNTSDIQSIELFHGSEWIKPKYRINKQCIVIEKQLKNMDFTAVKINYKCNNKIN